MNAADFAYSHTDRLVIKQLLKYRTMAVTILHGATPEQHCLVYMAAPNTSGGLVVRDSPTHKIIFGSSGLTLQPTKLATLKLHSYPAAMSLCFRACVAIEASSSSPFKDSVVNALRIMQVETTRQYEELCLSTSRDEAEKL